MSIENDVRTVKAAVGNRVKDCAAFNRIHIHMLSLEDDVNSLREQLSQFEELRELLRQIVQ